MPDWETVITRGAPDAEEFTLLVAAGDPENVRQLMRTATDIARFEGGSVHVVSVVHEPYGSEFGVFTDETIREEFARDRRAVLGRAIDAGASTDTAVTGSVVVARHVADGILQAADNADADAILVGWRDRRRTDAVLGTMVDSLLERSPRDVLVERIGTTADGVESVLVPVAGSRHAALAARVGGAIATANDARLLLLAVSAGSVDVETATEYVERTERALLELWEGPARTDRTSLRVDCSVVEGESITDVIAAEAEAHDVVLMGATRGNALRRRLVGSIPQAVTRRTDQTVLLAQRSTEFSRLSRVLGRLRRS